MHVTPVGVILAAGQGTRMGGPKALLMAGDCSLLELHVARLREAGCRDVVAVTPASLAIRVHAMLATAPWDDGVDVLGVSTASPAESLCAAYEHLGSPTCGAWLVTHVDRMPAKTTTLRLLVSRIGAGVHVATPVHAGRSGHPIALHPACLRQSFDSLRVLVRSATVTRSHVHVQDAAVLENLNDAVAYERAFATRPRFCGEAVDP